MPSRAEILRALNGAWLLARGDPRGLDWFDLTVDGFWASFAAALIVAPAYALLLLEQYGRLGWPEELGSTIVAEALTFVLGWVLFPVLAIFLTRALGLSARYVPLIVAGNWSAVVQVGLYCAVAFLAVAMPDAVRSMLLLAATLVVLVYQWFVARTALQTTGLVAATLVAADIVLSLTLNRALDTLLQPA